MKSDKKIYALVLILVSVYLIISFFIVKDYGVTCDEPENFGIGHKYLYYYQTGQLNFKDDNPEIEGHPNFYNKFVKLGPHQQSAFANILSALACYIFYQKLHLLDPISAHHIVIPILTTVFLYILFLFVKEHWGNSAGLISVLALITYPRFFGHIFNNIKDIPEIIFFSITIVLFVEWVLSGRIKYLYPAFICFGFALATKPDAILIPIILILWQAPFLYKSIVNDSSTRIRTLLHIIVGFAITSIIVLSCFPPLLPWQPDKVNFLFGMFYYTGFISKAPDISWNLYAPSQIFYLTPVVMLLLFISGLIWAFSKLRSDKLYLLLIIWVLFPILRHCLPHVNHYDGLRHFLVFIVPFIVIVSIGVSHLSNICLRFIKIKKGLLLTFICILFLIPNLFSLISLHPYQTTYFNFLIGGLKGAQKKDFPFSSDFWFNSYREAGEWLDKKANSDSHYYAFPYDDLFKYSVSREDLKPISPDKALPHIPSNTYVVIVPRKWWPKMKYESLGKILSVVEKLKIVYQIKRQGGEILTIYYKP